MKFPLLITVIIIVLAGGFFLFSPKNKAVAPAITENNTASSSGANASSSAQANPKTFTLVVKNKKLVSGPETITVTQGDNVVIKITADEDEELHLHGYDKSIDLEKDKEGQLAFPATVSGRFAYELEHSKTDIGALEVQPK